MNDLALDQLALTLVNGEKLIILAGAGLSMAAPTEFDGGSDLARRIIQTVRAEFPDFPDTNDPGVVFDTLVDRDLAQGAARFIAIVQDVGPAYYPTNAGHAALIKLYLEDTIQNIYSLNVDPQLELCSTRLILNAGWLDAGDIGGNARAHSLALRWSEHGVEGVNLPPRLQKLHGCILRDPNRTIWSATQLSGTDWPAGARWAQTGFESDIQHFTLLIVGCGYPVAYLNRSIEQGKGHAAVQKRSYLVSIEPFADYAAHRNPDLIRVAGVGEDTFFDISASELLDRLLASFSKKLLNKIENDLVTQIGAVAQYSVEHSVFLEERPALLDHVHQIIENFRGDLHLLQRFLKRSLLWARDLAFPQIGEYYIPLHSNQDSLNDLLKTLALLRLSLGECVLDPEQIVFSLRLPNGCPVIAVYCRGLLPQQIRDEIMGRLLNSQGPVLPQALTLLLLHAQVSTEDLLRVPPRNRTRAVGPLNRTNVRTNPPDTWNLATGGDTIERAAYLSSAEWRTLMMESIG